MVVSKTDHWPDDLSESIETIENQNLKRSNVEILNEQIDYYYYYIHEHAWNEFGESKKREVYSTAARQIGQYSYEKFNGLQKKIDKMESDQAEYALLYIGMKVLNNGKGRITALLKLKYRQIRDYF